MFELVVLSGAEGDILETEINLDEIDPALSDRFHARLEEAFEQMRLLLDPSIGRRTGDF